MMKSMQWLAAVVFVSGGSAWLADEASAQDPFIGEIRMFAGNFAPRGWAFCDGQLLPISQNRKQS